MFLMNAPPVVALQSKWEGFGPPGSFRFPRCFSEADEGVESAAVSARVQMLITTLQRDGAARGTSDERAVQRGHRAEGCHDARPAAKPPVHKEPPALAACGLVAGIDPMGEEAAADFGPLVLDSDSDDSVDRDIEEAIQEYLKAKSGAPQPGAGGVQPGAAQQPSRASGGSSRCKPEPAHSSAPTALGPPKLAPGSGGGPGIQGASSQDQGSASPVSVSSDDSFEQSIRAEIEQFLNEKRQHETQKCDGSVDKKPDPNENSAAKSLLKSHQEPAARGLHRQGLMGTQKEFTFRRPPRLAKMNMQPRNLRSTVTTTQENEGSAKPAAPGRPSEAAQNQIGTKRSTSTARRGGRVPSAAQAPEASDSSSDDGIEEAIQLYQLQKTRKEADGDPSQRAQPREERQPDPPAHSTSSATKSALPESHRKTPGKKKPVAAKATDPGPGGLDTDRFPRLPKETKAPPPVSPASRSEFVERSLCRADTSAELMCAEAILDISKTILPAPAKGSDGSLSASPLFHSANVPSRSDGDSSSVDSDDSIEQEIRTFLALKAQSGSLLARGESCPQAAQGPLSPPGPNSQTSGPKVPLSKTPDSLLGCKRKRRGGGHVRPSVPKKTREVVKDGGRDADHSQGRAEPGHEGRDLPVQGKASEAPGEEGAARLSQGQGKTDEARRLDEKESSDDKSSSLDSDEDLDTAIKDLLRSKRKLKKRCREPRAACRKKVRFSTSQTHFLEQLGGLRRDREDRRPPVLKSCLSKSKRDGGEGSGKKSPSVFGGSAERMKQECAGNQDTVPAFRVRRPASASTCASASEGNPFPRESQGSAPSPGSLSDDSSSVDSDDSIELEIRKFLAEKAKESVSSSEVQAEGPAALGTGGPARPEVLGRKEPALPPGMCTRSQRARGTPQPAEGSRGTESLGAQGAAGLFSQGGKGLPAAPGRGDPALPRSTSISAKGLSLSRKNVYIHRDQSPQGTEPAAKSAFGQLPSCATAGTEAAGARGTFHMGYGGRGFLTPSPGAERDARAQADRTLPWSDFAHQSRLPSPWALRSDGRDTAWSVGVGIEREKGSEGPARGLPSLPLAGFSPLLSTQLFHFGKGVSWGGRQAGLFSPHLGLPLQGPSFSAFREAQAGPSPVFGSPHLLAKKDGGSWPSRKAQPGLSLHDRRSSGSEESVLDLRYRRRVMDRDDQDQDALGSDASDFSDTSGEDSGGSSVVKV
ncbi:protein phosphatase 1 regulatory subunit 26 [Cebus imitator]|uniref:protein phosphatase 1 regulatory subunit 26 n=1 Tax=Cebus imitator TaxID=2715852 RepID=UPI00080A6ADB|nr:protein phosphatase 1 regulatory subunit 26 [Cebus imitator]XP_017368556.1 protein phosphatase 1 regulatory subunit 26 [Cebus imitator]XP_017368558.1 protein phosphatase 1 regulatory subunit 26 [Cebus imitator]XP_037588915.1 protein phosphatase 1 regulatory subunit 26 [Cebus imitator]XP_037588916.1 protein phosphatase 1 regulatory subunit 26 [Cebus imitator]